MESALSGSFANGILLTSKHSPLLLNAHGRSYAYVRMHRILNASNLA